MVRTFSVTLSGIIAALETLILIISGFVPVADYALAAVAGVLSMAVIIEINIGWAFAVYAVSSGLGMLISPGKETVLLYIPFFGCYPVFKELIERIPKKWVSYPVKFAFFNAAAIAAFLLLKYIFNISDEVFTVFGVYLPYLFLIAGNIVFIIYDFALTGLAVTYYRRIHPAVSRLSRKK